MKTEENPITIFAKLIQQLRKERGWSQPDLGEKSGISWQIIGRYEREEITPSIEVARKMAEAFNVLVDYLVSDRDLPDSLNGDMIARLRSLDELPLEDKDRILSLVDIMIRDTKAREAYKVG